MNMSEDFSYTIYVVKKEKVEAFNKGKPWYRFVRRGIIESDIILIL